MLTRNPVKNSNHELQKKLSCDTYPEQKSSKWNILTIILKGDYTNKKIKN